MKRLPTSSRPSAARPVTQIVVESDEDRCRLDVFLAQRFRLYSRVQLRRAIHAGDVEVDGVSVKASYRLNPGQQVTVRLPELSGQDHRPEAIPLEILFEDEHLAAVNKPPAMVVHPAKGHWSGTLVNALAHRFQQLSTVGGPARPGIVHRLDRDTSGLVVVAKTDQAHHRLAALFESRQIEKEYLAIVTPAPDRDRDLIDQPIGIHPYQREKMAIRSGHTSSREAQTFYEVVERFDGLAVLRVLPKTGRTHQIRVHLAHIGCPILCDRLYSGRAEITREDLSRRPEPTREVVLARQALHAHVLRFQHPVTEEALELQAAVPEDLQHTLDRLREFRANS